jgi:hypothetical protein
VAVEVSYFSLASIVALALFLGLVIPRAILHLVAVLGRAASGKPAGVDRWLLAIAVAVLVCGGLAVFTAVDGSRAHSLLDRSDAVALSFLFFAAPGVLQVMGAWFHRRGRRTSALSHVLVALAIASLPAAMAIPTAALLQATGAQDPLAAQPAPAPADNPAAAVANTRFFTDSEFANDPDDYPLARWLDAQATWRFTAAPHPDMRGMNFYREVPTFTAFWIDQTSSAVSFDATDAFGLVVSKIDNVRGNYAFDLAVFAYKLLCALVLAAVTYDAVLRPLFERTAKSRQPKG